MKNRGFMTEYNVDVLIIGGSHAGLSAAMALGRIGRSALIIDSGHPRNKVSEHANNFAGFDGINPNQWREQARNDLLKYDTISFLRNTVVDVKKLAKNFQAILSNNERILAKKVILAYGIKDQFPAIVGVNELWGKSVFHCPYCHGFEVKGQSIGILGNSPAVEHLLPIIKNLSAKLFVFTQGKSKLTENFMAKLRQHSIHLIEEPIKTLKHQSSLLKKVVLSNNESISIDALFLTPTSKLTLSSSIDEQLGCEKDDMGFIKVKEMGQTSVAGVFAAGDIMTMQQSVVGASASGQIAGSAAVFELSNEEF